MGLKIYSITNKINNKKYIGVTKDLDTRKRKHFWELKNNRHSNEKLQRDYNVFGASAFEVEILEELKYATKKEGFKKEVFYIGKYNSCDDGYNMSYGADGSNLSQITDDTREKHRQEMLGNTYWLGRKHTEETKKKIGDVHRGKTVKASTRKKLSEKAKEKTGEKNPFYGKQHTDGTKQKLREARSKNVDVLRQVLSITLSKNVLKKWGFRKLELILIKFV
ncbi:MAG: NUMOD3 domain-containing DNA-binding protein [Streptococcus salivarius]